MKKLISLLLILVILLSLVGCKEQEQPSESASGSDGANIKETVPPTYKSNGKKYDNSVLKISGSTMDWVAVPFEEHLKRVTHIVKAEFLGTVVEGGKQEYYLFDFKVKEVLRGELSDERISVKVSPLEFECIPSVLGIKYFSTEFINYTVNKNYLLLLSRTMNSYTDLDILSPIDEGSLVIPLDEKGTPNVAESKMYQVKLLSCIKDEALKSDIKKGLFLESILGRTKNNPSISNYEDTLINEKNTDTILSAADVVYDLEIKKRVDDLGYMSLYECKLISTKKGEAPITDEDGFFKLYLPTKKVTIGNKYTVALNNYQNIISRNAIFPYTE